MEKGTIRFWFGVDKEQAIDLNASGSGVIPPNLSHMALMIGDGEETDTWDPSRKDWMDGTDHCLKQWSSIWAFKTKMPLSWHPAKGWARSLLF